MSGVIVERATKTFDQKVALNHVSLTVQAGEFLTVLGPSGSGKTTLLRLIAGLEVLDTGRILINEQIVSSREVWVPPQQRNLGMVFQNYALWPHLTTFENVAFPLQMAGLPAAEITAQVREVLTLVELSGLERKRPGEMSGGEQQRVALARALVSRPTVLLMDECLSNLDARLREKMAGELRRIHESVGITTIYVTHDQQEALVLSDRLAVLHQGVLQQVGPPDELYHQPRNPLVATSLGPINLLSLAELRQLGLVAHLPGNLAPDTILGVRPEYVHIIPIGSSNSTEQPGILGRVKRTVFRGNVHQCWIEVEHYLFHAQIPLDHGLTKHPGLGLLPGHQVGVSVDPEKWLVMTRDTGEMQV